MERLANNPDPLRFDRLVSAEEWCVAYRQCGLPAVVDRDGLTLMLTGPVAAVRMPERLGELVQPWLRQYMVAGPVLGRHAESGAQWTFLASRNVEPRAETQAELDEAGAELCADGTPLWLPAALARAEHSSWWVQAPELARELPVLSAVICAVRVNARELARGGELAVAR